MHIKRMTLEDWFDRYQYEVEYDLGESAMRTQSTSDLVIDLAGVELRYGHHQGLPRLRELIAEQYEGLTADDVLVTTGASEALALMAMTLLEPGDRCVIEKPTYPTTYLIPQMLGATVDPLWLRPENGWRLDLDDFDNAVRGELQYVAISHPNNPTGSQLSAADLGRLIEIADRHGRILLSDETYRELTYDEPLPPAASLYRRGVSISTMSKAYGVPGVRIGWIATRDHELLRRLLAAREYISITNNTLGEVIAAQILADRARHIDRARDQVSTNLAILRQWAQSQPYIHWSTPDAGVVSLAEVDERLDAAVLYRDLAEQFKTFVVPASTFDLPQRFFRLGFGARPDDLREALRRLDLAVAANDASTAKKLQPQRSPARGFRMARLIDLSMPIHPAMPTNAPDHFPPAIEQYGTVERDGWMGSTLTIDTHCGTHIDAPCHFIAGAATVDQIPTERFFGDAVVCDVRAGGPGAIDAELVDVPRGSRVLLATGGSDTAPQDPGRYFSAYGYPSEDLAQYLIDQEVSLVGIDSPSVDAPNESAVHRALLGRGIVIVENMCRLTALPSVCDVTILPLALRGLDGSPARAFARLDARS